MAEVYARLEAIERTSGPMHDFAIRDSNGILRVAGGNLPALGISPAQEGLRVTDQYGNPIFDTLGLTNVMSQPGSAAHIGYTTLTVPSSSPVPNVPIAIPGLSVPFTLSRPTVVWAVASICALAGTAGRVAANISFNSGSLDPNANNALFDTSASTGFTNGALYLSKTLAAGSWTAYVLASDPSAGFGSITMNVFDGSLYLFQLGS